MSAVPRLARYLRRLGVEFEAEGGEVHVFYADDGPYYVIARPPHTVRTTAPGGAGTVVSALLPVGRERVEVCSGDMALVWSGMWPGEPVLADAETALLLVVGRLHLTANGLPTAEPRRMLPEPTTAQMEGGEGVCREAPSVPQELIVRGEDGKA